MGMFDYVNGLKVPCPKCGKNREREWQTKDLYCGLVTIKIGDKIHTQHPKMIISDVRVYGNCPICHTMHFVNLKVKDGILTDDFDEIISFAELLKRHSVIMK